MVCEVILFHPLHKVQGFVFYCSSHSFQSVLNYSTCAKSYLGIGLLVLNTKPFGSKELQRSHVSGYTGRV